MKRSEIWGIKDDWRVIVDNGKALKEEVVT